MRSDARRIAVLATAAALVGCGGFGRGEPSPDAGCRATGPGFDADVHPILLTRCAACHAPSQVAGGTDLVLVRDVETDHASIVALVDTTAPEASKLLVKGGGDGHGGGAALPAASADHATVLAWIEAGAPLSAGACAVTRDGATGDGGATAPDAADGIDAAAVDAGVDAATDAALDAAGPADGGADAAATDAGAGDASADAFVPTGPSFAATVHPLLIDDCMVCHVATGIASGTDFVLVDDAAADYTTALEFVEEDDPESSPLLVKAIGTAHGGGVRFATTSDEYATVIEWIEGSALP